MKKLLLASFMMLASSLSVTAQHSHGNKGANGGPMEDVAGVHAELTTSSNTITFHITNEDGKPVATKSFTGSALMVSGNTRETIALIPSGENQLTGSSKASVTSSTQITLQLKTEAGKTGQARFKK